MFLSAALDAKNNPAKPGTAVMSVSVTFQKDPENF